MAPNDGRRFRVNDPIKYVGPDDGELRPGEIGRVIENGKPGSVVVRCLRHRRIIVK